MNESKGGQMNQLSKLGFTVGDENLAPIVSKSDAEIAEQIKKGGLHQPGRIGHDNFRERLEKSLGQQLDQRPNMGAGGTVVKGEAKAGASEVKNTHGEEFHTDNDKQVEEEVTKIEEVEIDKSDAMDLADLFLKGFDTSEDLEKGGHVERAKVMFRHQAERAQFEAKKSMTGELDELVDLIKGFPAPSSKPQKNAPVLPKDEEQKREEQAAARSLGFKKGDSLIEQIAEKTPAKTVAAVHENSGVANRTNAKAQDKANQLLRDNAKKSFVKSQGPGGIIFDFGAMTGNPIADRTTALLSQMADPVQQQNAQYQQDAYNKALGDYVSQGESYRSTPFANLGGQLEKGMDQQVADESKDVLARIAAGERPASDTPFAKSKAASQPITAFSDTQMNVGGEIVKAQSETDAAVLEMLKSSGMDLSGMGDSGAVDVRGGGAVKITAGIPLDAQLPDAQ